MTIERTVLVGVDDIKSIHYRCKKCGSRVTRSLKGADRVPPQCGECATTFRDDEEPFVEFVRALKVLRDRQAGGAVELLMELDAPEMR